VYVVGNHMQEKIIDPTRPQICKTYTVEHQRNASRNPMCNIKTCNCKIGKATKDATRET
jgi:hypothetical protein